MDDVNNEFFRICFLYLKNWGEPLDVSYVTETCNIQIDILYELEFRGWIRFMNTSMKQFEITDLGKNTGIYKLAGLEFGGNIWETTIYSEWLKVINNEVCI